MSTSARSLFAVLALSVAAAGQERGACIECHSDPARVASEELRRPVAMFEKDVHRERGLSCHDCHGGDPTIDARADDALARSHAASADFRGRPDAAEIPAFCGRCHSDAEYMGGFSPGSRVDQETQFLTSVHGQRLAGGDANVATCISCHGSVEGPANGSAATPARAHGILPVAHPRSPVYPTNVAQTCGHCHADEALMRPYGIPTDQFAAYETSVHRRQLVEHEDLSAPTCNDCHGNHGARPPAVESIAHVCGTCHVRQAKLFRESSMMFAFDMAELGECTVCHSNHAVLAPTEALLLSPQPPADSGVMRCAECHTEAEDPALGITEQVHDALVGLDHDIQAARAVIDDAERRGMPVSEARYQLADAQSSLIDGRTLVHMFQADPVLEVAEQGRAKAEIAQTHGLAAIDAYFFRHRWLAVSLVGIALVILSLVLKTRQVDRRWRAAAGATPGAAPPDKRAALETKP